MGKDFTDMSKPFGTPFDEWSVVNGMLPHRYHPPLRNNAWERLAAEIAAEVFPGVEMVQDYDQLLDKRPGKGDAVFAMHQDMAYWPPASLTANDTRTVTLTLAIDDETADNGCIRYVPGSQKERKLRPHRPLARGTRGRPRRSGRGGGRRGDTPRRGAPRRCDAARRVGRPRLAGQSVAAAPPDLRDRLPHAGHRRRRAGCRLYAQHNDDVNWDVFNPEIAAAAARAEL